MKKKIVIIIGVIFVVLIAGIMSLYFSLSSIVASRIKVFGTSITGTNVGIDSINISPFSGSVEIKSFCIANPKDYRPDNAIALSHFYMDLNLKSIFTDKIIIKNVIIDDIMVNYELSATRGNSNLQEINDNMTAYFKAGQKNKTVAGENKESGRKVIIKYFVIKNGTISVSSSFLNTSIKVPMRKIEMYDIGAGDNKTSGYVIKEIYAMILQGISSAVSNTEGIPEGVSNASADLGKTVNDNLKSLQSLIGL